MECFAKSIYQPGGDLLRIHAKSLKYRYVDVITILTSLQIS